MLRFDRKQQNYVKQLSFNKTLIKKKRIAAPHFAEVETEAQAGEMPSKAAHLGAGAVPELVLISPSLAAFPP